MNAIYIAGWVIVILFRDERTLVNIFFVFIFSGVMKPS